MEFTEDTLFSSSKMADTTYEKIFIFSRINLHFHWKFASQYPAVDELTLDDLQEHELNWLISLSAQPSANAYAQDSTCQFEGEGDEHSSRDLYR